MHGPTLADDFYALEAAYDLSVKDLANAVEDLDNTRGERDEAYALLREVRRQVLLDCGGQEPSCLGAPWVALLRRIEQVTA